MPETKAGKKVMRNMKKEYGEEKEEKAEEVFYASINKGKKESEKWHKKGGFHKAMGL